MYLVLTSATRKCLYGGQGTGEIILLNLTDLVLLLIECMPAASGVRRKAAAAAVGVATGSVAATALANAARTDKTIEDMRAGEVAGTHGVPNPSKANANCNYVAKTTTPGECGEWPCTQDMVCELMFDKMLAYMHETTATMQQQSMQLASMQQHLATAIFFAEQKVKTRGDAGGAALVIDTYVYGRERCAQKPSNLQQGMATKCVDTAPVPEASALTSKFLKWASTHIEPCAASHILLRNLHSAIKQQKVFGVGFETSRSLPGEAAFEHSRLPANARKCTQMHAMQAMQASARFQGSETPCPDICPDFICVLTCSEPDCLCCQLPGGIRDFAQPPGSRVRLHLSIRE